MKKTVFKILSVCVLACIIALSFGACSDKNDYSDIGTEVNDLSTAVEIVGSLRDKDNFVFEYSSRVSVSYTQEKTVYNKAEYDEGKAAVIEIDESTNNLQQNAGSTDRYSLLTYYVKDGATQVWSKKYASENYVRLDDSDRSMRQALEEDTKYLYALATIENFAVASNWDEGSGFFLSGDVPGDFTAVYVNTGKVMYVEDRGGAFLSISFYGFDMVEIKQPKERWYDTLPQWLQELLSLMF